MEPGVTPMIPSALVGAFSSVYSRDKKSILSLELYLGLGCWLYCCPRYLLETFGHAQKRHPCDQSPSIGWDFSRSNWGSCMRFVKLVLKLISLNAPNQNP